MRNAAFAACLAALLVTGCDIFDKKKEPLPGDAAADPTAPTSSAASTTNHDGMHGPRDMSPADRAAAMHLARTGPPREEVGLEPFAVAPVSGRR